MGHNRDDRRADVGRRPPTRRMTRRRWLLVAVIGVLAPLVIVVWSTPGRTATQTLIAQVRTAVRPSPTSQARPDLQPPSVSPSAVRTPAPPTKATPRAAATPRTQKRPSGSLSEAGNDWEMVPVRDLPPYNEAVIKNSTDSTRTIGVCRDWGKKSCRSGSPTGRLKPGENSGTKFKWHDTDGFNDGSGWIQQHGCFGCTVTIPAH